MSISFDSDILKGGGFFAVKRDADTFDCYDRDGVFICRAKRLPKHLRNLQWGEWEHGASDNTIAQEIAHKEAILAAKQEAIENQKRIERASRLLARLGANTLVGFDDARAAGFCQTGIEAFAREAGLTLNDKVSLPEIAKLRPAEAVVLARKIISEKRRKAV